MLIQYTDAKKPFITYWKSVEIAAKYSIGRMLKKLVSGIKEKGVPENPVSLKKQIRE